MQTYIVIFESKNKAEALRKYIKSYGTWGKITSNAWAVVTTNSSVQIRDGLNKHKDPGDTVFVIRSGAIAAWNNVPANSDWLKRHL